MRQRHPGCFGGGDSSRVIAAGELLAALVAVRLFHPADCPGRAWYRLAGVTDNLGNAFVVKKLLTTKRPLGPLLMQLTCDLFERQLWLDLQWVKRNLNQEADALTNQDFKLFSPSLRIPISWKDVSLPVAQSLFDAEPSFQDQLDQAKGQGAADSSSSTLANRHVTKRKVSSLEPW